MTTDYLKDYRDRNSDSIVTVQHPKRDDIRFEGFFSIPQLTQNLSAMYGQGVKELLGTAGNSMQQNSGKAGKGARFVNMAGMAMNAAHSWQTSQNTIAGTVMLYEGSSTISIPVDMTIFPGFGINPSYKELDLMMNKLTQPKLYADNILGSNLYDSPELWETVLTLDYNALTGKLPMVSIGEWFHAKDVYITNLAKNSSSILDEDGVPAYISVSFNVQPYRQLTAEELNSWLV